MKINKLLNFLAKNEHNNLNGCKFKNLFQKLLLWHRTRHHR
jgi:hypothetical protein